MAREKQAHYQAEVVIQRPDGSRHKYTGDGVGPEESGDQLLAGAEQAARRRSPA